MELSGRSVLVTGAHGLLGSWLVKALLEHDTLGEADILTVTGLAAPETSAAAAS